MAPPLNTPLPANVKKSQLNYYPRKSIHSNRYIIVHDEMVLIFFMNTIAKTLANGYVFDMTDWRFKIKISRFTDKRWTNWLMEQ